MVFIKLIVSKKKILFGSHLAKINHCDYSVVKILLLNNYLKILPE